jgi:hypothetical protein
LAAARAGGLRSAEGEPAGDAAAEAATAGSASSGGSAGSAD